MTGAIGGFRFVKLVRRFKVRRVGKYEWNWKSRRLSNLSRLTRGDHSDPVSYPDPSPQSVRLSRRTVIPGQCVSSSDPGVQ